MAPAPDVRRLDAAAVRPLRHAVLRAGQPPEAAVWPGDDALDTAHFGAFADGRLVGVASLFHASPPGAPHDAGDWQLRGMATLPEARGARHGVALVQAALEHARGRGGARVWCHARVGAGGFYLKLGFARVGDEYDIPGIGPHWFMERRLR